MIVLLIFPVFLVILLGFALRRLFPEAFWPAAERLTYMVLLPALLVSICAGADLASGRFLAMAAAIGLAMLAITVIALALRPMVSDDGAQFTSTVQGAIRFNGYIGLATAGALYGAEGLAAAAIAALTIVLFGNIISVAVLATYGKDAAPRLARVVALLAGNPLLIACALGLALNLTGLGLPLVLAELLELVGRAALPIGLLAVGAGLRLEIRRAQVKALAASSALKLVLLPLVTAGLAWALGVTGLALAIAVLFNALPTASSSYILARQLGGDAPLMAAIITLQTLLALASLPIVLMLMGS